MSTDQATTDIDGAEDADAATEPALAALLVRLAATPPRSRPVLAPGARLGSFVVEVLLGRGGMGEVWRAVDTRLQRPVALKVLQHGAPEPRLLEEARAAAAVQHPRVATLFEVGTAPGPTGAVPFIALELVPGDTLRKRLREGPRPVAEVLALALDAAEGLAAVHARGLVHRDIKPDNLALDAQGRVKLLDFGLAALAGAEADAFGTPRYMPPEQRAEGKADARTDVFALGVTLLELLTGQAPFDDDGALRPDLQGDALRRARALPTLPRPFLDLLGRCVALEPARRPESGAALVAELSPLAHPRPSARERAAPWLTVTLAAALTVVFLTLVQRVEDVVAADLPPALASVPALSNDARVRARFRAAADALLAGDNATATAVLAEVAQAEPASPWPWALLLVAGEGRRAGADPVKARAAVQRLADPKTREGRAVLALTALSDARALGGAQPIPPNAPAVALGRAALQEAGNDAFTAVLLAALLPWQADVQEKLDRIDAGLSRDARVALLWLARSQALLASGRADDAQAAAREGLTRIPGNAALEDALARARIAGGDAMAVAREARDRLRVQPDDVGARLLLLEAARAQGDGATARAEALALLDGPFARAAIGRAVAELALAHQRVGAEPADEALWQRARAALEEAGLAQLAGPARPLAAATELPATPR